MTDIVSHQIVHIPVKNLCVMWVQAQRPHDPKWSKTIADNFDPDKFDAIIVTLPNGDGIYHIIEGQHRRHALEMFAAKMNKSGKGCDEKAPCRVVGEADPARAADIWLSVNKDGRKAVKPIHSFKVAVVAGREMEVGINQVVVANKYRVAQEKQTNCIAAVAAMRTVYTRHGRMTLNSVLKTLRLMWNGDPAAVTSEMLRGFGVFMNEFGTHVDPKRMIKIAQRMSPHKVLTAAKTWKESAQVPIDEGMAEWLRREYNKGMKESQRLHRKG